MSRTDRHIAVNVQDQPHREECTESIPALLPLTSDPGREQHGKLPAQ
jgi:hypothetical protein